MNTGLIEKRLRESIQAKQEVLHNPALLQEIARLADAIGTAILGGGKLLLCGNGGSAADALHIAGEILGRFQKERPGFGAIALNADVATLTAIANDYGYDEVFARQVEGLMKPRDILMGISTSGHSRNVVRAFEKAKEIGGTVALLAGKDGGVLKSMADIPVVVPAQVTARVQECHLCIYHILCELVEDRLIGDA